MANSIPDPIVLPDINKALPGEPIRADEVAKLLGCLNAANAYVGSGMVIQQSWADMPTLADFTEPPPDYPIRGIIFSPPTSHHTALRVRVRGHALNVGDLLDGSTVVVKSLFGDDEISAALPESPDDDWVTVGDLTIARSGSGSETVSFAIENTGEGDGRLLQVACEILPLSDPLPVEVIDGAVPFGLDNIVANRPLPAPLGHRIIETLSAIIERPLNILAWSGIAKLFLDSDEVDVYDPWTWWSTLGHVAYTPLNPRNIYVRVSDIPWYDEEGDPVAGGALVRVGSATVLLNEDLSAVGSLERSDPVDTGHADPLVEMHPVVVSLGDQPDNRLLDLISVWTVMP